MALGPEYQYYVVKFFFHIDIGLAGGETSSMVSYGYLLFTAAIQVLQMLGITITWQSYGLACGVVMFIVLW